MPVACVLIPHFMAQVECQRRPSLKGRPVIVARSLGSRRTVLDYSSEVSAVHAGMVLQQAIARAGAAAILQADLPLYEEAFDRILDSLEQVSPAVEGESLGYAYVDLHGLERLYGGLPAVLASLLDAVPSPLEARIGVGCGKFPAYSAAVRARPRETVTVSEDVRGFLPGLELDALPVSPQIRERLKRFGLNTLGQVASLPMAALQAQFGPEGRLAWELASGIDPRPVVPRKHEVVIEERLSFPTPTISLAAIVAAAETLVSRAFSRSQLRGRCSRLATVRARIFRGDVWERRVAFRDPAGDSRRAFFTIKSALERSTFPGPLEDMTITFAKLTGESGRQGSLLNEVRRWEQLGEATRNLEASLGRRPLVYQMRDIEPWSRLPERRQALVPFDP